jgi:hypothetical protein
MFKVEIEAQFWGNEETEKDLFKDQSSQWTDCLERWRWNARLFIAIDKDKKGTIEGKNAVNVAGEINRSTAGVQQGIDNR